MWQHSARTFSGIMSLYDAEMTSINHMKRLHPMTMVVTLIPRSLTNLSLEADPIQARGPNLCLVCMRAVRYKNRFDASQPARHVD